MQTKLVRMTIVATTLPLAAPASAKVTFPVSVPFECVELAQRESVPLVINSRHEAMKAKYKLYRLNRNDPLVQQCKEAVERARQAERLQAAQQQPVPTQPGSQQAEQQSRVP